MKIGRGPLKKRIDSDGKGCAAAAICRCIGIVDFESLTDQIVGEINLGAAHIHLADAVDQNDGAVFFQHQIVVLARIVQCESILEAGTTTTIDGNPQHCTFRFARHDLGDPLGRPV